MKKFKEFLTEENYRYLDATPQDKEPHEIFNKATKQVVSTHPSKGVAYNVLMDKHHFDHNLTVLHHGSKQYKE